MLSFELSAIDLILVLAVIILSILYITKSSANERLFVEEKEASKKPEIEVTPPEEEIKILPSTQPQTNHTRCPYGFGYLGKLDKDDSIPEECLGCSKIIECVRTHTRI